MFTGIVTDIGTIIDVKEGDGIRKFRISTNYDASNFVDGISISCSGVCLTVIASGADWFEVDVSKESLSITTAGKWCKDTKINLERGMVAGDAFDGHIVTGHVDCIAEISNVKEVGENKEITIAFPDEYKSLIAKKGSICVDGISLTVNGIEDDKFWVNIIPHTLKYTTLGVVLAGDIVNMEIDIIARYTARCLEIASTS